MEQLQTEKAEIIHFESEAGVTSDTEWRKAPVRVRTWENFGHRMYERPS
ncbi:hypothetical protein V7021_12790 [Cytobacillus firmus]